jgi:cytochrome c peroxidase
VRVALFVILVVSLPAAARAAAPDIPARAALGRAIFFDQALSEPRGTSCASCHDPARALAGDNGSRAGVPAGSRRGQLARRSTPSLMYLKYVPRFRFVGEPEKHALDQEPYGGFFWDGRADVIADLVQQPLLNPREMNNRDLAQIARKLRRAPYAAVLFKEFPAAARDDRQAVAALGVAVEEFLTSPEMAPFSSRYDDFVAGRAALSPAEARGLALFRDPKRGGCARCHKLSSRPASVEPSLFTDFGYEVVGAPRNQRMPRALSAEPDRGLCERTDTNTPSNETQWCASFRTPSLRNVALRPSFMHNGAFSSLRDVIVFYATRASDPRRWYGRVLYDDTPPPYRGLIDVTSVPYNRKPGDPPAFTDAEIDDLVAFLQTLTDRRLPARR